MHAIGCFLHHNALRAVYDAVGYLFAAAGRQTVHEERIGAVFQQRFVDLKGLQRGDSFCPFLLLSHACPDIGIHNGRTLNGHHRIGRFHNIGSRENRFQMGAKSAVKLIGLRRGQCKSHSQQTTENRQRPSDVVAVADKRKLQSGHAANVLLERVNVGQRLTGMAIVAQSIDHRHRRRRRQLHERFVILHATDDSINILTEHAAKIGDALPR